jgi:hypothetical protein
MTYLGWRSSHFLLALAFVAMTSPAMAGQLFPPSNNGGDGCAPPSKVLVWSPVGGSVSCVDVNTMVTVAPSCPAGETIQSIINGVATCAGTQVATCDPGTVLTGVNDGSPVCAVPSSAAVTVPACPAGQMLTGVSNGEPVCVAAAGQIKFFQGYGCDQCPYGAWQYPPLPALWICKIKDQNGTVWGNLGNSNPSASNSCSNLNWHMWSY